MASPLSSDLTTLDEPVLTTLNRDLRQVYTKLRGVLVPSWVHRTLGTDPNFGEIPGENGEVRPSTLRDWDLWGPLLLCLILAICTSSSGANASERALVFGSIFVLVWCGSAVVTLNAILLGGKASFFQAVCVLGYCVAPLALASIVALFVSGWALKGPIVGCAFVWATGACVGYMGELVPERKRMLAVYPVCLFYLCISWIILMQ